MQGNILMVTKVSLRLFGRPGEEGGRDRIFGGWGGLAARGHFRTLDHVALAPFWIDSFYG